MLRALGSLLVGIWGSLTIIRVAVKELTSSYHSSETILLSIYPHYGNLDYKFLNSNPVKGVMLSIRWYLGSLKGSWGVLGGVRLCTALRL